MTNLNRLNRAYRKFSRGHFYGTETARDRVKNTTTVTGTFEKAAASRNGAAGSSDTRRRLSHLSSCALASVSPESRGLAYFPGSRRCRPLEHHELRSRPRAWSSPLVRPARIVYADRKIGAASNPAPGTFHVWLNTANGGGRSPRTLDGRSALAVASSTLSEER